MSYHRDPPFNKEEELWKSRLLALSAHQLFPISSELSFSFRIPLLGSDVISI